MKTKLHQNIKLPKTKSLFIHEADDIFTAWIDSDFKNYGLSEKTSKSEAMDMSVMELTENGTFKQIFESFGNPFDSLVVTQGQVIEFANTIEMDDQYDYFFLLKKDNEFFVARVHVLDRELEACVGRFSDVHVWHAEYRPRVVVPQLAIESSVSDTLTPCPVDSLEVMIEKIKKVGYEVYKKM